jgi:sugar transferase (PEP-CTERM/EpsH1 system associated)
VNWGGQPANQTPMRILFLTSRLPYPPDRGDRLRTNQFLRLFARDHEVTLLSFIADKRERQNAASLTPYCEDIHLLPLPAWKSGKNVVLNVWRDIPLQALYYRSRSMEKLVDDLLSSSSFDLVYVHLFRMAQYMDNHPEIYRILDLTDLISYEIRTSIPYQPAVWRLIYRFELSRIAKYEKHIASNFNEVWFIASRERDLFIENGQRLNSLVVPHVIGENFTSLRQNLAGPIKLLFVGHLEVRHNIDAVTYMAEQIMPYILQELPGVEFQIIGAGDTEKVIALDRLPGVRVIGYVSDLKTVFRQNAIAVAPLRFSAGVQTKVVESMAAGLAVVTTSNVNDGLGAIPERHLLIADTNLDFAAQVLRLALDGSLRNRLAEAGRIYVKTHYSSQEAKDRLNAIHEKIKG